MNGKQIMLAHEGHIISLAGCQGQSSAAEHAYAAVDGFVNGLLRIEDRQEVAKFVFALSDRVAGGIRAQTVWTPEKHPQQNPPLENPPPELSWESPVPEGGFVVFSNMERDLQSMVESPKSVEIVLQKRKPAWLLFAEVLVWSIYHPFFIEWWLTALVVNLSVVK